MRVRELLAVALAIGLMAACSSAPSEKAAEAQKPFFDAAVVDTFTPGKTTQADIRAALGEPYPEPQKSPERWTYMYTYRRQIVFTFKDGVLTGKTWSEEYGIGVGGH